MEKQHSPTAQEKKISKPQKAPALQTPKHSQITEEKPEVKEGGQEIKPEETKTEDAKLAEKKTEETKKEDKKKEKEKPKKKKFEAVVNGRDLGISTKHSMDICNAIRGKSIEYSVRMLEQVISFKKPLKMKGEIPHRHGPIMAGRYPINASKVFIKMLKQLAANASVNDIDVEKGRIECYANLASRPYHRGGSEHFKRTHVVLKLRVKENKQKNNKAKGKEI